MQKFPSINNDQVVVMRADTRTGNVLDENGLIAINDSQIVFTVFESLNSAVSFVDDSLKIVTYMEFVIYGPNKKLIKYISP